MGDGDTPLREFGRENRCGLRSATVSKAFQARLKIKHNDQHLLADSRLRWPADHRTKQRGRIEWLQLIEIEFSSSSLYEKEQPLFIPSIFNKKQLAACKWVQTINTAEPCSNFSLQARSNQFGFLQWKAADRTFHLLANSNSNWESGLELESAHDHGRDIIDYALEPCFHLTPANGFKLSSNQLLELLEVENLCESLCIHNQASLLGDSNWALLL